MLDEARVLGLDRLLAVCALDNLASAKDDRAARRRLGGHPGH